MSDYDMARAKHDEAWRRYQVILKAYREGSISDAKFLEARKVYTDATAEFDIAWEPSRASR